jgi:hypothetical protein
MTPAQSQRLADLVLWRSMLQDFLDHCRADDLPTSGAEEELAACIAEIQEIENG